jgi:hypothetical protein
LNRPDKSREIQVAASPPRFLQDRRHQDVLAALERIGLDPQKPEKPRYRRADPIP